MAPVDEELAAWNATGTRPMGIQKSGKLFYAKCRIDGKTVVAPSCSSMKDALLEREKLWERQRLAKQSRLLDTPRAAANRKKSAAFVERERKKGPDFDVAARQRAKERFDAAKGNAVHRLVVSVIKNVLNQHRKQDQTTRSREYNNEYRRKRYSADDQYRLLCRLRVRLVTFARTTGRVVSKNTDTASMIGCSPEELSLYLEQDGRCIADCEIDHIFPLCAYDLSDPVNATKAMHWSNLQLLTMEENRHKSGRLPTKAMADRVVSTSWPPGLDRNALLDKFDGWRSDLSMN